MNIESKVGNEKLKVFESVVNDYKSEISKKNEKILEMENLSKNESINENYYKNVLS